MRTAVLLLCLLLPACAQQPVVEIPVYKRAAPPAELSEWQPGRLPLWIAPGETATSCLTPEGERQLRDLMLGMVTQLCAWEAWAGAPITLYCENLRTLKLGEMMKELPSAGRM